MQTFDLIGIGSGPAGQRAAIQASKSGKHVALVEKAECVGGVCINTGTIPSKTMREAVVHLSGYQYQNIQNIYGVNYRVQGKDFQVGSRLPRAVCDPHRNRRHHLAAQPQQH
jgi:NAD(P) transhydrogenase